MKQSPYAVPAALAKVSEFSKEKWFCGACAYGIESIIIYYKNTKNCPKRFLRYAGVKVVWKELP
jgi:hypothetical protein